MNQSNLDIDLYAVLKIDKNAGHDEIQKAFKSLSRNFHPDKRRKAGDKEAAEDFFVLVKKAHDVLSDQVLRLAYDHGGLLAVEILKRSQVKASQSEDDDDAGDGAAQHSAQHDEGNHYEQLRKSKSDHEAARFIRNLVDRYRAERSLMQKSAIGVSGELKQRYDRKNGLQGGMGGSLRVSAHRSLTKQVDLSVSGQSLVTMMQRRLLAGRTTSAGLSYRPDNQSLCHVEYSVNQTNQSASQLSVQTNRRFANGTDVSVGLGGGMSQPFSSWMYSLSTKRLILLGSLQSMYHDGSQQSSPKPVKEQSIVEATKLLMSWNLGATLSGELQSLAMSVQNLVFPQWKVRLALFDSPFFKFTLDVDHEDSLHGALSWDFSWWRLKVTNEFSWGSGWALQYGLKYDTRGLKTGRAYTILLHLQSSDDWHLRVPISLAQTPNDFVWPLTSMVVLLLGQRLHEELLELCENVTSQSRKRSTENTRWSQNEASYTSGVMDGHTYMYDDIISRVAAKKREYESDCKGLVIIKAVWSFGNEQPNGCRQREEDVTNVLQYWVVESHLHVPAQRCRWWRSNGQHQSDSGGTDSQFWQLLKLAWNWLQLRNVDSPFPEDDDVGTLYIRYQLEDSVYEIRFQGHELLWLPNNRATMIGPVGGVE
mmetsp:Transcript_21959/g.51673  ORF Transcript_21959/g.51673 Transcript_21959/m.51673 type:complete len:649 (+) Transcript_21959:51-1997(+)